MRTDITIEAKGMAKRFGDNAAFEGIDFSVGRGEVVYVSGEMGSGKSILLGCLARRIRPTAGRLRFGGRKVGWGPVELKNYRSKVALISHNAQLDERKNLYQNCITAARCVSGITKEAAKRRALHELKKVGMEEALYEYPAALTKEKRQLAAIARALCAKPEVLLFDEPTGALMPGASEHIWRIIRDLAYTGHTMVIATRDTAFASEVATRAVTLKDGRITGEPRLGEAFALC